MYKCAFPPSSRIKIDWSGALNHIPAKTEFPRPASRQSEAKQFWHFIISWYDSTQTRAAAAIPTLFSICFHICELAMEFTYVKPNWGKRVLSDNLMTSISKVADSVSSEAVTVAGMESFFL